MPRKCCVPHCRSNYRESEYVSVFGFPKDEDRKLLWVQQINRDFTPTKHSVVCIKHFEDRYILREERRVREDGVVLCVKRRVPTLTKDGYPTIFNDEPQNYKYNRGRRKKIGYDSSKEFKPECVYLGHMSPGSVGTPPPIQIFTTPGRSQDRIQDISDSESDHLDNGPIQGKRIFDFMYLYNQLQKISMHNSKKNCGFFTLRPVAEHMDGLSSEITFKCNSCDANFVISLNDKSDGSDLNFSAVSGAEMTGIGFLGLKTLCDSIGMTSMSEKKYYKVQKDIELYDQTTEFMEEGKSYDNITIKQEYDYQPVQTNSLSQVYPSYSTKKTDPLKIRKRKLISNEIEFHPSSRKTDPGPRKMSYDNCNVPLKIGRRGTQLAPDIFINREIDVVPIKNDYPYT